MPGAGLGNEKGALLPNLPNIISTRYLHIAKSGALEVGLRH